MQDTDLSTVMSFMSSFSSNKDSQKIPSTQTRHDSSYSKDGPSEDAMRKPPMPAAPAQQYQNGGDAQPRAQRERAVSTSSRPMSMVQTYHPSMMDVTQDTLPELQPIFTFLNSHANKLYQEGYFLKLDDQNTREHLLRLELKLG